MVSEQIDGGDLNGVVARGEGDDGNETVNRELLASLMKILWGLHFPPNLLQVLRNAVGHGDFGSVRGFAQVQVVELKINAKFVGC